MPGASAPTISGLGRTTGSSAGRVGQGGSIAAERYFAVGETDFRRVIEQILEARPSFVFNTLIGESAYQFLRDFRAWRRSGASIRRGRSRSRAAPCRSRSLKPSAGMRSMGISAPASISPPSTSPANSAFVTAYRRRFPDGPAMSADAEAVLCRHEPAGPRAAHAGTDD